jgi:hypothetical protein
MAGKNIAAKTLSGDEGGIIPRAMAKLHLYVRV